MSLTWPASLESASHHQTRLVVIAVHTETLAASVTICMALEQQHSLHLVRDFCKHVTSHYSEGVGLIGACARRGLCGADETGERWRCGERVD